MVWLGQSTRPRFCAARGKRVKDIDGVDIGALYQRALRQAADATPDGPPAGPLPAQCSFMLDDLLTGEPGVLKQSLN
jgi:hypothetical protein